MRVRPAARAQALRGSRAAGPPWILGALAACGLFAAGPAEAASIDFDPSPGAELGSAFVDADTPGDGFEHLSGAPGAGTGAPASGAVEFSGTVPAGEYTLGDTAVYGGSTFGLAAGEQVRFGGDLRFDALDADGIALFGLADVSPSLSSLGLYATSTSAESRLNLRALHTPPSATDAQPVGSGVQTAPNGTTLDWLRVEARLAYDGSDLQVSATLSDIGPDGESPPAPLLSLAPTTFSNAGLGGSDELYLLFGGQEVLGGPDPGPAPAGPIYFDNVKAVPEPAAGLLVGGGLLGLGLGRRRRSGNRSG